MEVHGVGGTVGVTGTERPTPRMLELLTEAIAQLPLGTTVVQGGCVGVDAEAARIAHNRGLQVVTIYPANPSRIATSCRYKSVRVEQMPPRTTYRQRNERVVELSDWVIAVPEGPTNGVDRGSGTWMTIRIAQRAGLVVTVLEGWIGRPQTE